MGTPKRKHYVLHFNNLSLLDRGLKRVQLVSTNHQDNFFSQVVYPSQTTPRSQWFETTNDSHSSRSVRAGRQGAASCGHPNTLTGGGSTLCRGHLCVTQGLGLPGKSRNSPAQALRCSHLGGDTSPFPSISLAKAS